MYKVTYNGITYRSLQLACDRLGIHPNKRIKNAIAVLTI